MEHKYIHGDVGIIRQSRFWLQEKIRSAVKAYYLKLRMEKDIEMPVREKTRVKVRKKEMQ